MTGTKGKKTNKIRMDRLLVERALAESRERAQAMIVAGHVLVNGSKVEKAGTPVPADGEIRIIGEPLPYVSRGGLKLARALDEFRISVEDKKALDIGASTGGFTDCLLQRGCKKVYAVDVGYGQLSWKLRQDPRVIVIERTNIRHMELSRVPELMDIAVIDVSFISLEKIVPSVMQFLKPDAEIVALVKPQFEVGKAYVGKGGIVYDEVARRAAVERIERFVQGQGLQVKGIIQSPITGQDGNVEYLLYAARIG